VRIVRTPSGEVVPDRSGRLPGRGAYLCADGACWRLAVRRSAIERALGVPLPPDLLELLEHDSDPASLTGGPHGA
jgi:predicted RNA-binding protein YlxR (DUF448 family)